MNCWENFNTIFTSKQFTCEIGVNHCLHCLDLASIRYPTSKLRMKWYTKSSCSRRYLHFISIYSNNKKVNVIIGSLDRDLPKYRTEAVGKLEDFLPNNHHLSKLIQRIKKQILYELLNEVDITI